MNVNKCPELLAPAGDGERLRAALRYGADAVYVGADRFGMRAAAAYFSEEKLRESCALTHAHGAKLYLTCNTLPRNEEFAALPAFLSFAQDCGVDALIVTDLGVMALAKRYAPRLELHVSTQAGVTNYAAANELYALGAKRIVTARELSLAEIAEIRSKTPRELEIECFVHGAMCVSFSGRCLLSNYLTGRDSNRGDCAQPCRWQYALQEEKRPGEYFPIGEDADGTYILNSRDMCLLGHLPALAADGIDSFKIEGRAKSAYYTAVCVNAYRCALDGYATSGFDPAYRPADWILEEPLRVSHREYCTGFYFSSPRENAEIYGKGGYVRKWDVAAVAERWENGVLYASQRNRFFAGDTLEIMMRGAPPARVTVTDLRSGEGEPIESTPHPMMPFSFACPIAVPPGAYLRMERAETEIR
ncbi:MAG: U32 family peptidase [Clostridia bacterium]|nr:U32 family peptidase [Clostridia bacterium]